LSTEEFKQKVIAIRQTKAEPIFGAIEFQEGTLTSADQQAIITQA
jgi:hypothetical protein